jgi:hypothetical protein
VEAIQEGNKKVKTETAVPNNNPDIIIHDNENGMCMLLEAAILYRNVIKKEANKILKYKTLQYKYNVCGM